MTPPWLLGLLGIFIALCLELGLWLLTLGAASYYLLHDGLLLPACLVLVYAAVFVPPPKTQAATRWANRLGGAAFPMFALHIPLFTLFKRLEKIVSRRPWLCLGGHWDACLAAAGEVRLSVWVYPLYLLLTIAFCIAFQQQLVRRVRGLIEPPLLRRVLRTA